VWRPRQVRPAAENQPEEEEIRGAGSEVGQGRGDLQVHAHAEQYYGFCYKNLTCEFDLLGYTTSGFSLSSLHSLNYFLV